MTENGGNDMQGDEIMIIWLYIVRRLWVSPLALSEIAKQFCIEWVRAHFRFIKKPTLRYIFLRKTLRASGFLLIASVGSNASELQPGSGPLYAYSSTSSMYSSSSGSSYFYTVPLATGEHDLKEHESKQRVSLFTKKVRPCVKFITSLITIGKSFQVQKDRLTQEQLQVLFSPVSSFIEEDYTVLSRCWQDIRNLYEDSTTPREIIMFLSDAEKENFEHDGESLARRHAALYYAVCREDVPLVRILINNGAPVTHKYDLLERLIINCEERGEKRRRAETHELRGAGCSMPSLTSCTSRPARTLFLHPEDEAFNIAQLLLEHGASPKAAAEKAQGTLCIAKSCTHLRRKYEYSNSLGIGRKYRETTKPRDERSSSQKMLLEVPPGLQRSSPPPTPPASSEYVTMDLADLIEITENMDSTHMGDQDAGGR